MGILVKHLFIPPPPSINFELFFFYFLYSFFFFLSRLKIMNSRQLLCFFTILFSICKNGADSEKLLALPLPIQNHVIEMNTISKELVKRGYEVVFFLPRGFDINQLGQNTRVVRYGHKMVEKINHFFSRVNKQNNKLNTLTKMSGLREIICSHIYKDVNSLKKLREERFDFAIVDFVFFLKCLYLVPYNLSIPFASTGRHISQLDIGHPVTASLSYRSTPFKLEIPFHERVINLLYQFLSRLLVSYFVPRIDVSNIAPELSWSDEEDLPKKSDIFIESSDTILDFPEPVMPNFIRVGCLTVRTTNPLPHSVKNFFDTANNGVIVMSFGSKFQTSSLIHSLFLSVFQKLKQQIFWKCDEGKLFKNILMYSGLSENDVLAHPNTKLFIYHCGRNGLFESVYNGVPLLCIPHSEDQFENARKIVHFQIGQFLEISQFIEDDIQHAIIEILEEPKYLANIRNLSKIFRSRSETPAEQAAAALEHVIHFGGKHLRSNHIEQSLFQLLLGDIWLAAFVLFTFLFMFILFSVWKCVFIIHNIKKKLKSD